jgi:acyl-CoA thioesterase
MDPSTTSFRELLESRRRGEHGSDFTITDDWLQGRTSFGGLTAAFAVQAMRDEAGAAWPADVTLRALQTSFAAPIGGGDLHVSTRLLREGKHVSHVMAEVVQHGQVCSVMLGAFAGIRDSALPVRRLYRPAARPVEALATLPFVPSAMPGFLQHFEIRWADGPPPFSGGDGAAVSIYMRPWVDDRSVSGELLTVLLADLSAPPVIGQLTRPTPVSSVSWALELRPLAADPGDGWWRADTEALVVDAGYVNQAGRLWAPDGSLAALAYQVVTVSA